MAHLKQQAARIRTRQAILGGALALTLATGWAFIARPASSAIAAASREAASLREQLAADRERSAQLPALQAEVRSLADEVKRFRSLAPRSELDAAFKEIGALCERSGVRAYQFTQEPERRERAYVEQPCKLKFRGDFLAAASLLGRLESTEWLSRMRALSVRRVEPIGSGVPSSPAGAGDVVVELTLNFYFAD